MGDNDVGYDQRSFEAQLPLDYSLSLRNQRSEKAVMGATCAWYRPSFCGDFGDGCTVDRENPNLPGFRNWPVRFSSLVKVTYSRLRYAMPRVHKLLCAMRMSATRQ